MKQFVQVLVFALMSVLAMPIMSQDSNLPSSKKSNIKFSTIPQLHPVFLDSTKQASCKKTPPLKKTMASYLLNSRKGSTPDIRKELVKAHRALQCVTTKEFASLVKRFYKTQMLGQTNPETIQQIAPLVFLFLEHGGGKIVPFDVWLKENTPVLHKAQLNKDSFTSRLGFYWGAGDNLIKMTRVEEERLLRSFQTDAWQADMCLYRDMIPIENKTSLFCPEDCRTLVSSLNLQSEEVLEICSEFASAIDNVEGIQDGITDCLVEYVNNQKAKGHVACLVDQLRAHRDTNLDLSFDYSVDLRVSDFCQFSQGKKTIDVKEITSKIQETFDKQNTLEKLVNEKKQLLSEILAERTRIDREIHEAKRLMREQNGDIVIVPSEESKLLKKLLAKQAERATQTSKLISEIEKLKRETRDLLKPLQEEQKEQEEAQPEEVDGNAIQCNPIEDTCPDDCTLQDERIQGFHQCAGDDSGEPDIPEPGQPDPTVTMPLPDTGSGSPQAIEELVACMVAVSQEVDDQNDCPALVRCEDDSFSSADENTCSCERDQTEPISVRRCEDAILCAEEPCTCDGAPMEGFGTGSINDPKSILHLSNTSIKNK